MRKQRVFYTKYDWALLQNVGKTIMLDKPFINPKQLLLAAISKAFPPDRHIGKGAITVRSMEFYRSVKNIVLEEEPVQRLMGEPVEKLPETVSPTGSTIGEMLNEAFVKLTSSQKELTSSRDELALAQDELLTDHHELKSRIIRLEEKPEPVIDFSPIHRRMDKLELMIIGIRELLTRITNALDPQILKDVDIEVEKPEHEEERKLLKIAVIGLMGDQAHRLAEKCKENHLCSMTPYSNVKASSVKSLGMYDYALLTRHVAHAIQLAVVSNLGRERVKFLPSTSVDRIIETIRTLSTN